MTNETSMYNVLGGVLEEAKKREDAKRRRNDLRNARRRITRLGWRCLGGCWYKRCFREGAVQTIKIKSPLEVLEWEADELATLRARVQAEKNRRKK